MVLSSEMDLTEIRFIQKAFIEERGAEVFRKNRLSPTQLKPFKDSASPCTAVGNSETNCQWENENRQQPFIYYIKLLAMALRTNLETVSKRAIGIGGTCVSFFKGWTEFPHSLWRAASEFALVPTLLQASSNRVHIAIANIAEGS